MPRDIALARDTRNNGAVPGLVRCVDKSTDLPGNERGCLVSNGPTSWPPLDDDARIIWPTDPHECALLARKLFGQGLVETMDGCLDHATDMVLSPSPARPFEAESWLACVDRAYRQSFSSMSEKQKQIVLRLVRHVVYGVLLQALTSLDQFYVADVKIVLVGKGPDGQTLEAPVTSIEADLAEQFVLCTEEFSRHWTQLADDLRSPPQE
jgi:hypothetical protein